MEIDKRDSINEDEEEQKKKRGGGGCSGGSSSGQSSSNSCPGNSSGDPTSPSSLGDVNIPDVDNSINSMCKKTYTVYRSLPTINCCPITKRDNLADQFTPQHDLITMEKTVRDFLKLESKIYDPETTNPRFFASEDWVQQYEKDKNTVLAILDQYRANILKMEHLYTVVDNNSINMLKSIPNQDCKSAFQTNIFWTSRALKDWVNDWFILRNPYSITCLRPLDYWLPGLTGEMVSWMKLGHYCEAVQIHPISNETMIKQVDKLEGLIDRLMNSTAIDQTISKFLNVKETLEQKANQKEDKVFTSKVIDSQMGKKLGVTDAGVTNEKKEGTTYIAPKEDQVEDINLVCKLSCVKKLFQSLRDVSMIAMKTPKCVAPCGPGPFPLIWEMIDILAEPLYADLDHLNTLIEDRKNDFENPGKHCSVTHSLLCPRQLRIRITAFKLIIEQGVIEIMANQALLPKLGLNILDSMFNQLWELGEKGPNIQLPGWCQQAIDCINGFEDAMTDAWDEVYDCWEREFITRLWRIEVEHHGGGEGHPKNHKYVHENTVSTLHDHTHTVSGSTQPSGGDSHAHQVNIESQPSAGCDSVFQMTSELDGHLTCPGHLADLLKPVCVCYRNDDIEPLAKNYRSDLKNLCQWMTSAIEAIGLKFSAISIVMNDPSLNGKCCNGVPLAQINDLREKNNELLTKVEKAYGLYSDVNNMKNKKEYDEEIALQELQPNKYSNEDQMNMTSSVQSESNQLNLDGNVCKGGIITELQPWNHMTLKENKVQPKCIPSKCVCDKFDKVIESIAGFETWTIQD